MSPRTGELQGACVPAEQSVGTIENQVRSSTSLQRSSGPGLTSAPIWYLVVGMALTWSAIYLVLRKGVRSVGKVVMVTVPLPVILLAVLLIRGITLPGAMDGLSYYLTRAVLDRLVDVFSATQVCGSALALDFWTEEMLSSPVTRRFRKFLAESGIHPEEEYTPLDVGYLASIPGYEVIELTNVRLLERVYAQTRHLAEGQHILPENYAVLRKVR